MSEEKERWVVAIVAFVQLTLVLTMVFWSIENLIPEDADARRLQVWIELVGGTWPLDLDKYDVDRLTLSFAAALTVKFYLLLLPILGVIGLFYNLATVERRQLMRWIDLLKTRDGAIKAAILRDLINKRGVTDEESLKQTSDALDQLFKEGGKVWAEEYLPQMFDRDTVDDLLGQDHQVQGR